MAVLWGPELVQIYNEACRVLVGGKHPAALGQPAEAWWPEVRDLHAPILRGILEGGESGAFEDRPVRLEPGRPASLFNVSYSPVYDDDGSVAGVLLTMHETTRLHRAITELQQANALIGGIARGTEDMIAALDPQHRFIFLNDAYRREFRQLWDRDPELGMDLADALAAWPEQQCRALELWDRALAGESFAVTASFGPYADAQEHYDMRFSTVTGTDGTFLGAAHIMRNVTARVRAQQAAEARERTARELANALATERGKLAAVIDTLPVGVAIVDTRGVILSMNPVGLQMHGVSDERDLARLPREFRQAFELRQPDGGVLPRSEWPVARALRGEHVHGCQVQVNNRASGTSRILEYDVVPVHEPGGEVALFVFVIQDVTEAKALEEERERLLASETAAREAAEKSSTVKSQFLSVISHELRTPLTAVLGYTDLLEDGVPGPMNDRQREFLGRIKAGASHLVTIIDEILTFARAEAGREEVRLAKEDVAALTRSVVGMLAGEARARGLTLTCAGVDEPIIAFTDGGKVTQILLNLIGNAIRYTDDGSIHVTLTADDRVFSFSVHDTGPGIPADRREEIFEPFVQLDQSSTRVRGGTGLGLAICRKLSRMLGGDVTVAGEFGAGSTFTCTLPLGRPRTTATATT
jgi:PAS domain S-box-containing protein